MAEPQQQIEVQLGHLCNNRCVFCVSGQLSEQDRAPQLPPAPIRAQIEAARANGAQKITFLGGEPTIQRSFIGMLKLAVELDFDEIVIFTNGVMTPRESFRERVLRIVGGLGPDAKKRLIWRFSLQGGDREAHDATTVNPGAWDRIHESMQVLAERGARLSGNMCVVSGNHASVPKLAVVAERFGLEQLHLDMFRPRDSGDRTEEYLRGLMQAPYTEMAASFRALVQEVDTRLGPDYDLNIGNMPYCVAPDIAWRIHHDGEDTVTVAASGSGTTQEGFNKYLDKRSDKHKLPGCKDCVFNAQCGGVFDLYAEVHGHNELGPVTAEQLWALDKAGHHFTLLAADPVKRWAAEDSGWSVGRVDERAAEIDVSVRSGAAHWKLILRRAGRSSQRSGWHTIEAARWQAQVVGVAPAGDDAMADLQRAIGALARCLGDRAELDVPRLQADWQQQRAHLDRESKRLAMVRKRAAMMIDRLRGVSLGGLRQTTMRREGEQSLELNYGDDLQGLTLRLNLRPDAPATRPTLDHEARGLDEATTRRVNRDLSAALKGRQPLAVNA